MMINNLNEETEEILTSEQVVHETPNYKVVKLDDGTFKKNMKNKEYFSRIAETEEEKIELYTVFNDSDSSLVTQLKNIIDMEIIVKHIYILPSEYLDELTGIFDDDVTTRLLDSA